ncbi:MAG: CheA signal transduction histidine kinase [Rhodocyclaceae bacterium]|nr:CheA signal transduction histidine kinase [Rhodocyclaceae bacterium]
MIEDPDLYRLFKAESGQHLARLEEDLLRLEQSPADPALLEEAFRESHSLKGAARVLGLVRIESAALGLESVFNAARKGEAPLTPDIVTRLNQALGELRERVQEALAGGDMAEPASPRPSAPTQPPAASSRK